jgi:Kef-type K+ transport system membrane component KefB
MSPTPQRPSRSAAALAVFLSAAMANQSCAMTSIMLTDYRSRRDSQYQLLWVDAAVVGGALAVGTPLYALSNTGSTREDVGQGLLWGALGWAAWTVVWFALLRMPDSSSQARATPGVRGPHPAPQRW